MVFSPNDSPLAGREGSQLTGSKIGERLHAEAATSVSLRVLPAGAGGEAFEVQARGELQLGLLIGARRPLCMRSNAPPSPPASLPRGELKFGLHIGARRPPADAQLPSPGPPWRGVLRYRRAASCTPAFSYTAAPPFLVLRCVHKRLKFAEGTKDG